MKQVEIIVNRNDIDDLELQKLNITFDVDGLYRFGKFLCDMAGCDKLYLIEHSEDGSYGEQIDFSDAEPQYMQL